MGEVIEMFIVSFKEFFNISKDDTIIETEEVDSETTIETSDDIEDELEEVIAPRVNPKRLSANLNLLVVADGHYMSDEHIDLICNVDPGTYDLILFLGDVRFDYLEQLSERLEGRKIGVIGNHDRQGVLEEYRIENIHSKVIEFGGLRFTGFEGSHKYKNKDYPSFTQEESIIVSDKMDKADILISHTSPYGLHGEDDSSHIGLKGISKYIYDNDVKLNIHGHFHEDRVVLMDDGTVVIGIYGAAIMNTKDYSVKKIY